VRDYMSDLSRTGGEGMRALDAAPVAPDAMFAAMRAYVLPQTRPATGDDATELMTVMWEKHRVQLASNAFQGKLLVRLSAQIYLDRGDFERGIDALAQEGWPGRS
jgi:hypothetical protein